MFAGIVVVTLLALGAGAGVLWLRRYLADGTEKLVAAIDNLLPQIQCAQCGHPGCRAYAEALARGATTIDRCPPGGERTQLALAELLGDAPGGAPLPSPARTHLARIDEAACIGCALCLPACPVDAIVGASGFLHTVIAAECTACELCLELCPVDCIALVPRPEHPVSTA